MEYNPAYLKQPPTEFADRIVNLDPVSLVMLGMDTHVFSPYEIAEITIMEDRTLRKLIRRGTVTTEEVALYFGFKRAWDECFDGQMSVTPPTIETTDTIVDVVDSLPSEDDVYRLFAQRLECDVLELKNAVGVYKGKIKDYYDRVAEGAEIAIRLQNNL